MNNWLNDSNPASLSHHALFDPSIDPSMAFLQPPQTINPAQFQFQPVPHLNGAGRTASPAFHNPVYQTNSVIPSKRQREDSVSASPRQAPGGLPGSRSQTPGQPAYPAFNQQVNGAPPFSNAPTSLQHLQPGSAAAATPSPTPQQMNYAQNGPQRVSTASPSPFSPHHTGPPQRSPHPPDHVSRMGTPHDGQNFMPNAPFQAGFNPAQFSQGMLSNPGQMGMNAQMQFAAQQQLQHQGMTPAQRQYQLQMQASARNLQAQQARTMNGVGVPNPQLSAMQQATTPAKPNTPEDFLRQLQGFMAARGRTVDINPVICSRPISLMRLYAIVMKSGGSAKISKPNQWPLVAQQFGFPQAQLAQAAQELQNYWISNLAPYESAWIANQQKNQIRLTAQGGMQNQMSPTRAGLQGDDLSNLSHQRSAADAMNMKGPGQILNNIQQPPNNFMAQGQLKDGQDFAAVSQHRPNLSRQFDGSQLNGVPGPGPMPSPQKRPQSSSDKPLGIEAEPSMPIKKPIEDPFQPETLPPRRFHGPINTDEMTALGQSILEVKPINPHMRELGVIDIHALTMAIKSGIHAETRLALDILVTLSTEHTLQLSLVQCDDLMETLIDCAQDQLDFLAEHAAEVSDEMLLTSYEELVRGCKFDTQQVQEVHPFGSVEYDLDRAADRIICITTLIRNLSFYEVNFGVLGMAEVIKFLTTVIRYLGTKEMLLRTNRNTLDFMKDVIIYLSNLSHSIQLPSREEASCFLHFLLAFAPSPPPVSAASDKVTFTMYNPNVHKYMPSAVDSLAKLLARDEPNRMFYKSIFLSDAHSNTPYELLTRAFGLAISPLPTSRSQSKATVEARKPFLLQGMLAAEILAGLIPSSEHTLARSWLESEDGFAAYLLRLVALLSSDRTVQNPQRLPPQQGRNAPEQDGNAYGAISNRAMAILRSLVQRSRTNTGDGLTVLPPGVLPKKETLLGAMLEKDIDSQILRQLCIYSGLED